MEKPEDIPQWAWNRAVEITMGTMAFGSPLFTERLARAILSAVEEEREACARIADPIEPNGPMSDYEKQCFDLRDVISSAIRNRKGV